ncbi:MAG: efflux transporter periplasmic adaptor subunit, partial [Alphaproteobacteria bacterium]|nr:efflux transporter periplasmic adaptor subunit [Alphaproteobacteria bacterium]
MRFLRRSLSAIFLLAVTLGLVGIAVSSIYEALQARWSQEARERPGRERVFAVNVTEAEPQSITPILSSFGEVRSKRTLELRASAAGEVIYIAEDFADGGEVEAGALLMQIDPQDAEDNLAVAKTDLAEAEADLRDARRALDLARDELAAAEKQAALRDRALARQRDLVERQVGTE